MYKHTYTYYFAFMYAKCFVSHFLCLIHHGVLLILVHTELPHFFLQLHSIPLCGCNVIYLNSPLLVEVV